MGRRSKSYLAFITSVVTLTGVVINGCTTEAVVGGVTAGTVVGASMPTQEIRQVYYLGVFDPQEQVPTAIYRLTVHGQASFLSGKKFASGWMPANMVDSLNTDLGFDDRGFITVSQAEGAAQSELQAGRRLVLFGPEGFREAPRNHRLVLVMASDPEEFFAAVTGGLDTMASVQVQRMQADTSKEVIQELAALQVERQRIQSMKERVERDVVIPGGAQ